MRGFFYSAVILIMFAAPVFEQSTQSSEDCTEAKAEVARLEARLKDWPALGRYHESNTKVSPPSKDEKRIVFMGDSITDFWSREGSGGFFPGKPYINRGISGQTTQQMLIRFRPDVIALKPKLVVILAGTNDLAVLPDATVLQSIQDNLTSMTELARAHGIRVVLASLLPVSDYEKDKDGKPIIQSGRRQPAKIKAMNEWMKKYASENGLTYLDYYSVTADERGFLRDEMSNDGLHPNAKGYAAMGPLAEQAIAAAFKHQK